MKRTKRILIPVLVILFLIFLIYKFYHASKSSGILNSSDVNLERILTKSCLDSTVATSAFYSKYDTMYNLKFNNYWMTVWQIFNYKNADSITINHAFNLRNRDFNLTIISEVKVSSVLEIKYKIPDHAAEYLTLNFPKRSEIYDTLSYKQNKGYYFRTSKFGIGDLRKRSSIIFDFKEKRDMVFLFLDKEDQNYILLFYPANDEKINSEALLRMLK